MKDTMFKPRQISAERKALADAIANITERKARIAATSAAYEQAREHHTACYTRLDEAQKVLEGVQDALTEHAIAKAQGTAGQAPMTLSEARRAVDDAEADLEAASAAKERLKIAAEDAAAGMWLPETNVKKVAANVVAALPEVQKIVDSFQRLQRELIEAGATIKWLSDIGAVSLENVKTEAGYVFSPAKRAVVALETAPSFWAVETSGRTAAFERLAVFFHALQTDPDATTVLPAP
jgi:chromosome segregation ATPase